MRANQINRHGLTRSIPSAIRQQVRQDCGFGCVFCGHAVCQYEHIDPPFHEARQHRAADIALLCATCHDEVTRGFRSKLAVRRARAAPRTFKMGIVRASFEFASPFDLIIGSNRIHDVSSIIKSRNDDFDWFRIDPPEMEGAPPRLTARFFDENGETALEIVENEWRCSTSVWDLQTEGPVIRVRRGPKEIALQIRAAPPHGLDLQRLHMYHYRSEIRVLPSGRVVIRVGGAEIGWERSTVHPGETVFSIP